MPSQSTIQLHQIFHAASFAQSSTLPYPLQIEQKTLDRLLAAVTNDQNIRVLEVVMVNLLRMKRMEQHC